MTFIRYVALYCSCQHFTKSVRFLTQVRFLGSQLRVVLKSLLSGTSLCFIEHLLRSLFQNKRTHTAMMIPLHMSREWALYGQVGGKRSWCKCEVVPVISNRGSQWGSATDSYESGSAASNGAVLLFGNAYYKCHLSALPGTPPSLRHVNRDCSVPCFHATTVLPPAVLGERRDSVISTCASSGPTWRISTGWLMLGLFNIQNSPSANSLFLHALLIFRHILRLSPAAPGLDAWRFLPS